MRNCGDCQLCCKLVPVKSLGKAAGERCKHQSHSKGCKIYEHRPNCCRLWSCAWLMGNDTADLRRPDRVHYVIDCMPEFIKVSDNATGEIHKIPVVQIWIDPRYPNAHEDPALRRFLLRRGEQHVLGLIHNEQDSFVLWPPNMADDGQWHMQTGQSEEAHSAEEIVEATGMRIEWEDETT
jgi:hypothetical protein